METNKLVCAHVCAQERKRRSRMIRTSHEHIGKGVDAISDDQPCHPPIISVLSMILPLPRSSRALSYMPNPEGVGRETGWETHQRHRRATSVSLCPTRVSLIITSSTPIYLLLFPYVRHGHARQRHARGMCLGSHHIQTGAGNFFPKIEVGAPFAMLSRLFHTPSLWICVSRRTLSRMGGQLSRDGREGSISSVVLRSASKASEGTRMGLAGRVYPAEITSARRGV